MVEYAQISAWVKEMFGRHCDRVVVKVIDAASIEGFYKSLVYGMHRYPAVVVNRQARFSGSHSLESAGEQISTLLSAPVAA